MARRSSSGALSSLEEQRNGTTHTDSEQDGFYLLRKDSQRRMTLSKVLTQDEVRICEDWMMNIDRELGDTNLTTVSRVNRRRVRTQTETKVLLLQKHLQHLLRGMKEFILDQNKQAVESTIRNLKDELEFDYCAINHLHLAIYLVQESVSVKSRSRRLLVM